MKCSKFSWLSETYPRDNPIHINSYAGLYKHQPAQQTVCSKKSGPRILMLLLPCDFEDSTIFYGFFSSSFSRKYIIPGSLYSSPQYHKVAIVIQQKKRKVMFIRSPPEKIEKGRILVGGIPRFPRSISSSHRIHGVIITPPKTNIFPWEMMVGRRCSFWNGPVSGGMLIFGKLPTVPYKSNQM